MTAALKENYRTKGQMFSLMFKIFLQIHVLYKKINTDSSIHSSIHTHSKKAELIATAKTSEKRYMGAEGKEAGVY